MRPQFLFSVSWKLLLRRKPYWNPVLQVSQRKKLDHSSSLHLAVTVEEIWTTMRKNLLYFLLLALSYQLRSIVVFFILLNVKRVLIAWMLLKGAMRRTAMVVIVEMVGIVDTEEEAGHIRGVAAFRGVGIVLVPMTDRFGRDIRAVAVEIVATVDDIAVRGRRNAKPVAPTTGEV
ncbi:hypothetical protein COOONC_00442, partial [Cooperia oncophora]